MLKITQIRSGIGRPPKQKKILQALGLGRPNRTVVHADSPIIRGMVNKIGHLVKWETVADEKAEK